MQTSQTKQARPKAANKKHARVTRSTGAKLDAAKVKSQPQTAYPTIAELGKAANKAVVKLANDSSFADYSLRDLANLVSNAMDAMSQHPECSDYLSDHLSSLACEVENFAEGAKKKAAEKPESFSQAEGKRIAAEMADPANRRVSLTAAVRDLFDVIFQGGDVDESQAKAFAVIIDELDEDDGNRRQANLQLLLNELFRRTGKCDEVVNSFVRDARREYVLNGFGAW